MKEIKIEKYANGLPVIVLPTREVIPIESAEAHLMLMILNKLDEIRCGIIDVENLLTPKESE